MYKSPHQILFIQPTQLDCTPPLLVQPPGVSNLKETALFFFFFCTMTFSPQAIFFLQKLW
jgi:hypothetical protein